MPYAPIKVANEFLRLARSNVPASHLTPLQLLKLVYIAHGWSLHFYQQPLINEQSQAWQYGPVVPSLYHATKEYRALPITDFIIGDYDPQSLSSDDVSLISAVYKAYGHLSGTQLSNMTHMPETPWSQTWDTAGRNAVIPDDLISEHYGILAARRLEDSSAGANAP